MNRGGSIFFLFFLFFLQVENFFFKKKKFPLNYARAYCLRLRAFGCGQQRESDNPGTGPPYIYWLLQVWRLGGCEWRYIILCGTGIVLALRSTAWAGMEFWGYSVSLMIMNWRKFCSSIVSTVHYNTFIMHYACVMNFFF